MKRISFSRPLTFETLFSHCVNRDSADISGIAGGCACAFEISGFCPVTFFSASINFSFTAYYWLRDACAELIPLSPDKLHDERERDFKSCHCSSYHYVNAVVAFALNPDFCSFLLVLFAHLIRPLLFPGSLLGHQHHQNPPPHPSLLLMKGTSDTRDRLPDEFDGTSEGSECPGSFLTRASSSTSSGRPSAASLSSSTTSSSTRGGSSRCSSRGKEQVDHRTASRTGLHTKSDFCSISSSQILLPVIPNVRRGSKDVSEPDLKSCPIIPGRNSLIEITKKSIGLGLNVIGGSDTPLVSFSHSRSPGHLRADGAFRTSFLSHITKKSTRVRRASDG